MAVANRSRSVDVESDGFVAILRPLGSCWAILAG